MAKLRPEQNGYPFAPLPVSGQVVKAEGITDNSGSALQSGRCTFYPQKVAAGTYDALVLNVTTAQVAGTVLAKAALYPDDGTGAMPNTSGGPAAVASFTVLTSTGVKVATFPSAWNAPSGLYWMAFVYVATSAPTTTPAVNCILKVSYSIPSTSGNFTAHIRAWQRTGLTDLPTDATSTANASGVGANDVPMLGLRRA